MSENGGQKTGTLAIFGIAILLNLLLSILILDQLDRTRDEIRERSMEFATKQDVASFRPLGINRILENRCFECHNARRLAATLTMEPNEIVSTVARMSAHTGGAIPSKEFDRIAAALFVRRCTTCHGESIVSRMLLYEEGELLPFLREKVAMPGSGFRSDQVEELVDAIRLLAELGS